MKKTPILIIFLVAIMLVSCKKKTEAPAPKQVVNNEKDKEDKDKASFTLSIEDFAISLAENPNADKSLGKLIATATDKKVILSFELQNQSRAEALRIDSKTGELIVNNASQFDYESSENHTITAQCLVKAEDQSITGNITITLSDIKGEPFVTKWHVSANETISLNQITGASGYDFEVDWGDQKSQTFNTQYSYTHKYNNEGDYEVKITGTYPGFSIQTQKAFTTVIAWGDNQWKNMGWMFYDCDQFKTIEAHDQPNLSECPEMAYMFYQSGSFNGDISHWDTKNVINMEGMFHEAIAFDVDIKGWDTQNVENMSSMFSGATVFNQDLSDWTVDNVDRWEEFAKKSELICDHVPDRFTNSDCK